MEITTTYTKQNPSVKPGASQEQKPKPAAGELGEKSSQIAEDSVELSKKSLELAQTSAARADVKAAPVENGEQARNAVAQWVSAIRDNPEAAKQVHGNLSQLNLKLLLE